MIGRPPTDSCRCNELLPCKPVRNNESFSTQRLLDEAGISSRCIPSDKRFATDGFPAESISRSFLRGLFVGSGGGSGGETTGTPSGRIRLQGERRAPLSLVNPNNLPG